MNAYPFLYRLVQIGLRFWHPVFRVKGRENIPAQGNLVICGNHSGMADPIWLLMALNCTRKCPCIMAKEEALHYPIVGPVLASVGVFPVKRGENDVNAVKHGLRCLKEGKSLMLFPEGTRVRPGKTVEPKSGAMMFALRTGTPLLPVYVEPRHFPFAPTRCVIGKPWLPETADKKATQEQLHELTLELMDRIYRLGDTK